MAKAFRYADMKSKLPLQPRQLMIAPAAAGCNRRSGRTAERGRSSWHQHNLANDTAFAEQLMGLSCF